VPVALDTPSLRDLALRARIPALVLLAAVALAIFIGGPAQTVIDALHRVTAADPGWALAAIGFEICSFAGYIALLAHVTGLGARESYRTTVAGAAATRLLPTAGAGGAALTLWVLKKTGKGGAHTLLTFLVLLYAVFLAALLGASLAAGAWLPAALAAAAMLVAPFVPRLSAAVRDAAQLLRDHNPRLLGAPAWWAFDCAVLWAAFHAVGTPPSTDVLIVGYFLGQVANTIPVPGAASGGMIGVFVAFGVAPELAVAAVLAYRAIAVWLPAPAGAHALAALRRAPAPAAAM
jgi:putative heme transporter